ncbi:MAG: transcriptional regulator [Alicyclobacillus sp. RIFOXYA1_FULL_53_8]|nr:MAG: transcriptional regulator [Alicyclobacillus sp. RIFOXYA1_FULL_53_8]
MNTMILSALAEPDRKRIVESLCDGSRSVGEVAEKLALRQPQASKHLRVLSEAGLVEVRPVANVRIYQLRAQPLEELDAWIETFRHVWEDRFNRLDDYLRTLHENEARDDSEK